MPCSFTKTHPRAQGTRRCSPHLQQASLHIGVDGFQADVRIQAGEPETALLTGVVNALRVTIDVHPANILVNDEVFAQPGNIAVGEALFPPVDAGGGRRGNLHDQAGMGAVVGGWAVFRIAGQEQVGVIEVGVVAIVHPHLHVRHEELAAALAGQGVQSRAQGHGDQAMPVAGTRHGQHLSGQIFVLDIAGLLAVQIVLNRYHGFEPALRRHDGLHRHFLAKLDLPPNDVKPPIMRALIDIDGHPQYLTFFLLGVGHGKHEVIQ